MKKKIISVIQYIFFLLIGLVLLFFVFRKLDLHEVWNEIKHARYEWLLASLLLGVFSHISRAFRWRILINSLGYKPPVKNIFFSVMFGYLANAAFPRLGEVSRCAILSKKNNIPFNSLFGTVIAERFFDLIILVLIILMVIFLQLDFLREFVDKYFVSSLTGYLNTRNIILLIIVGFIVIVLPVVFFFVFYQKIKEFALYKKIRDFVKGLLEGAKTIIKMRHKLAFMAWTLVIWTFYSLMTYTAFFSLEATSGLNFFDGITIMALGSLGIVAPVPGGIGAYQFIVKAILVEIYLIAAEPAASYSIVAWAAQSVLIIFGGIISYYILVIKKSKKNEKTTA